MNHVSAFLDHQHLIVDSRDPVATLDHAFAFFLQNHRLIEGCRGLVAEMDHVSVVYFHVSVFRGFSGCWVEQTFRHITCRETLEEHDDNIILIIVKGRIQLIDSYKAPAWNSDK
ncbi:hypothetical protein AVEN_96699-1 [Araneus ventricosus]|uniref:Uncharacterized protein n=1 Tax=Araneus ventricosus TaxID=182803 RepID=A0A4Y2EA03_ARAVE|nr:hypothetical protein AVEN_96699-1 [Araneus ventricosus]